MIKKIDETGSTVHATGAGRLRTARCDDNINRVESRRQTGTHSTQRKISREFGISRPTVQRILKKDLRLRCFKKRRATELTEANKLARLRRARQLLRKYPASLVNVIVFTDEKVFTVARPSNTQNDRGMGVAGVKFWVSPLSGVVALTTHSHGYFSCISIFRPSSFPPYFLFLLFPFLISAPPPSFPQRGEQET